MMRFLLLVLLAIAFSVPALADNGDPCSHDFQCASTGGKCVKDQNSTKGYCAGGWK